MRIDLRDLVGFFRCLYAMGVEQVCFDDDGDILTIAGCDSCAGECDFYCLSLQPTFDSSVSLANEYYSKLLELM